MEEVELCGKEERFIGNNPELFGFYRGNILVQAVKELVDNSYDACRANESVASMIKIKLCERGEYVVLEVVDNGIGIVSPQQCFSCFTSSVDCRQRIGKYGLGLSVASYFSCCYCSDGVRLLTSCRAEGRTRVWEIRFAGLSPIITETESDIIMEDTGTLIQMNFPVSLLECHKEMATIYEYLARLQLAAVFPLVIEVATEFVGNESLLRICSPSCASTPSRVMRENLGSDLLQWLMQTLPAVTCHHVEMGRWESSKEDIVEVHCIACTVETDVTPSKLVEDSADLSVPIKVWTSMNGKPLEGISECAISQQFQYMRGFPKYYRVCCGEERAWCIRSRKPKALWSAELERLVASASILIIINVISATAQFHDLRKKSVVALSEEIMLHLRKGVRATLMQVIENSFLREIIFDQARYRDKYLERIAAPSISLSLVSWLQAKQDPNERNVWLERLGLRSMEEMKDALEQLLKNRCGTADTA